MKKNLIHPTALLIGDVEIGEGNFIGSNALLIGPIRVGNNNFIGPNTVIGTPPQDDFQSLGEHIDLMTGNGDKVIRIGNENIIREFVTIHKPQLNLTEILDSNYLMSYVHIPHDAHIASHVKIANSLQMGGYCRIMEGAYVGLSCTILQFSIIGANAMIGMGTVINRDIEPGSLVVGNPVKTIGSNKIGLEKAYGSHDWWKGIETDLSEAPAKYLEDLNQYKNSRIIRNDLRKQVAKIRADKETK